MKSLLQLLLFVLAAWSVWWLVRKMLRAQAPAEPADDPFAAVGAPRKRGPKGLAGAVAMKEPEDDDFEAFPPRSQ